MTLLGLEGIRVRLSATVRRRIAGDQFEDAHARIFDRPGARWFTEDDPIWRVHADASMFVGGIRALLLQSLHPLAMAAVSQHSGFRGDPWGRLQRTSAFLATTTYGTIEAAEQLIGTINRIHGKIMGRTRDGLAYRADDPELLTWVHLAEIDSFLTAHDHFGAPPLTAGERDSYVDQTAGIARRLGVPDPPTTTSDLAGRLASYRPVLRLTDEATEAADLVVRHPPVTGLEQLGYRSLVAGAISILPSWARAALGWPLLPITDRLLTRPISRTTVRSVGWLMAVS